MQLPEALQLPPAIQAVAAISAAALAVVRLLTASRPFWAWEKVPIWVQKLLPTLLMAVAALPVALEHARSWLDIIAALIITGAMWFTASRGDKRQPEDKGGGPRIDRVNSDPKVDVGPWDDTPPSLPGARMIEWRDLPAFAFVALVLLAGCSSSPPLEPRGPNDPCTPAEHRDAKLAYQEDVHLHCATYDVLDDCPFYPKLKAAFERKVDEGCGP